jgi:hypothetical protein
VTVDIASMTIEFFRFGKEPGGLFEGNKYIRTCGYQHPAEEVSVRIEPKAFVRSLNQLRYGPVGRPGGEGAAKQKLSAEAERFLELARIADVRTTLHQVDIVTHASELRAYPFEAIYADPSLAPLESEDAGVIVTRRIRSDFSYSASPWPEVPSVLFVHAQVDHDLPQDLIDRHRQALCEALAPWGNAQEKKMLVVEQIRSVKDLERVRKGGNFSYVHILAHGATVTTQGLEDHQSEWGLRLGGRDSKAASPKAVAGALALDDKGYPLVVTLAACDSANANPVLGNSSLVETLHRNGIPVVISSQLPLTQPGSVMLTKAFYQALLSGTDVRHALHAARVALRKEAREDGERRHDWLSLVGYVRLPEGYARYLREFALRVRLRMLEAARKDSEPVFAACPPVQDEFGKVERRLGDNLAQLLKDKEGLSGDQGTDLEAECTGLLASGNKSLAECRFVQSSRFGGQLDAGMTALAESSRFYTETFKRNLTKHWHGVQMLALQAALTGRITDPMELMIVRRVAQYASETNKKDYWACGTLAETMLLGALVPDGFDHAGAEAALRELRTRSGDDPKDNGFAVQATRRQLQRYVNWWTKTNGYFKGRDSDLSAEAGALDKFLASCQ